MAEAARLREEEEADEDLRFDDEEEADDDLDISLKSLMDDVVDELEEENMIDMMPLYHDTVIEISMEELLKYNRAHGL